MAFNVFICYSTKDLPKVNAVRTALSSDQVHVFVAEYSVDPGGQFNASIHKAISEADLFLPLWSKHAMMSAYAPLEVGAAWGLKKMILPVLLDENIPLPPVLSDLKYLAIHRSTIESIQWLQQHVTKLAHAKRQNAWAALAVLVTVVAVLSSDG